LRAQFELTADCPSCGVEGVVVEVYDPSEPACALGLPAEARCRLCEAAWVVRLTEGPDSKGVAARGTGHCPCCGHALGDDELAAHACSRCGSRARREPSREAADVKDRAALERALRRMADEEGEALDAFVASNFVGRTLDEVHARIARGEPVDTGFSVLFSLFQRGAGTVRGGSIAARRSTPPRPITVPPPRDVAHAYDPRAMVLALVSVLAADGHYDAREMAFIERFVVAEGMAPLRPEEMRVHRPLEVSGRIPPARRAEVVELMTELACIDGSADPSELRIVESYATAWGISPDELAAWLERYRARYATDLQRFLRRVRAFFLAPRDPHAHPPRREPT
jgi:uncharacterized tellurite resistance protein B-like protein